MIKIAKQGLWLLLVGIACNIPCVFATNPDGMPVYQKQLEPEHKLKLAADITRYRTAENLWDVLREDFTLPHYEDHPLVQEKIQWYMNNQDDLLRCALRAAPYLYYIFNQVKKRHLPAELVLLPIIESGYNPFVTSIVGASGIWQMMPNTATGYGIKQDQWYDGRRDLVASTNGALNYLSYLQSFFDGNWLLAIAAYNTGEGNVLAAIRKNIKESRRTDFWSLPVAQQTKDYVPRLLALAAIISHPNQYPVYFPPVRNAPYLAQVKIDKQMSLKLAAQLAGISYSKIKKLNPGLKMLLTAHQNPHQLILPIENVEQFTDNLARNKRLQQKDWIHYKVTNADTLSTIAKKHHTSVLALQTFNQLHSTKIRKGMVLLIPTKWIKDELNTAIALENKHNTKKLKQNLIAKNNKSSDTIAVLKNTIKYTLQPGDTIYMVRMNDTLKSIATRFHANPKFLSLVNQLDGSKLNVGQQLIIPTHDASNNIVYVVKRGDTLEKIASKYRTSASVIKLINLVDNTSLLAGDKLIIPTNIRG